MNPKRKDSLLVIKILLLAGILAISLPVAASAQDLPPLPEGCVPGVLPDKVNPQQLILTCVPVPPVDFNGTLFLYAHGYVKPQKPLALPLGELEAFFPLIGSLQGSGFAFGTTSYSTNGVAFEQAENDLNALVNHFKSLLGESLKKVLLVGASEGGLITTMMIEKHPEIYYGGLAMCGPNAGMPYQVRYLNGLSKLKNLEPFLHAQQASNRQ
jgi:pimeloyl-ACP methyl ester carboxylesterase